MTILNKSPAPPSSAKKTARPNLSLQLTSKHLGTSRSVLGLLKVIKCSRVFEMISTVLNPVVSNQ